MCIQLGQETSEKNNFVYMSPHKILISHGVTCVLSLVIWSLQYKSAFPFLVISWSYTQALHTKSFVFNYASTRGISRNIGERYHATPDLLFRAVPWIFAQQK